MVFIKEIMNLSFPSGSSIVRISSFEWQDRSPYSPVEITAGSIVYQYLKQPLIEGKFTTSDIDNFYTSLASEGIIVWATGRRGLVVARLTLVDADNTTGSYAFTDWQLNSVGMQGLSNDEIKTDAQWTIEFTAKSVAKT